MKVQWIAIAALGKNREIGLKGKLPWNLPEEYAHFQKTILGEYVLIGRKNFEAHGGKIPGSHPLILTKDRNFSSPHAKTFNDVAAVAQYAEENQLKRLYVMGGAEIYQLTLPYWDEFLWTEVDYVGPADAYFPEFSHYPWELVREEAHAGWKLFHLRKIPDGQEKNR